MFSSNSLFSDQHKTATKRFENYTVGLNCTTRSRFLRPYIFLNVANYLAIMRFILSNKMSMLIKYISFSIEFKQWPNHFLVNPRLDLCTLWPQARHPHFPAALPGVCTQISDWTQTTPQCDSTTLLTSWNRYLYNCIANCIGVGSTILFFLSGSWNSRCI